MRAVCVEMGVSRRRGHGSWQPLRAEPQGSRAGAACIGGSKALRAGVSRPAAGVTLVCVCLWFSFFG